MKKNKRIVNISLICSIFLMVALSLCVVFSRIENGHTPGDNVHMQQYSISGSEQNFFTYEIVSETSSDNKYEIAYAKITGLNSSYFVSFYGTSLTSSDYFEIEFPSVISVTSNSNTIEYPVLEIDIALTLSGGVFSTQFKTDDATIANNLGYSLTEHVNKIIVPKSVRKISYGAFNGFIALTDVELPFIGTEREHQSSVHDAFLAIFGSKNYTTEDGVTGDFQTMRVGTLSYLTTPVDNQQITDVVDYTKWYNYSVTDSDADPTAEIVKNNTVQMAYPQDLKNIIITDEYSIDNHAFFYIPNVESIAIQFSEELQTPGTDIINAARVGLSAFANCYWLKTVALPSTLENGTISNTISSLSEGVFRQCQSLHTLTTYHEYSDNGFIEYTLSSGKQQIVIPTTTPITDISESTSVIPESFLYACLSATYVVLPNDVTAISEHAFERCINLSILDFKNNSSNKTVGTCRIPSYIETIGKDAFAECTSFTTLIVPSTVVEIGEGAFSLASNLTSITLPFIGKCAGNTGKEALFGYIFGTKSSSTDLSAYTLQNEYGDPLNSDSSYYVIPKGLVNVTITSETYVSSGAFMNCDMIKSLQIDDPSGVGEVSIMEIGHAALAGCTNIESLSIPFVGPYDVTDFDPRAVSSSTSTPHLPVTYPTGTSASNYRLGWIFGVYDYSASGMVAVSQNSTNDFYISPKLKNISLTHQTVLLIDCFYNLKTITSVDIGEHTQYAQQWVFGENSKLESITLPFVGMERGYTNYDYLNYGWIHGYRARFANVVSYLFRYNSEYCESGSYESSVDCDFDQLYPCGAGWRSNWAASIPKTLYSISIYDETYFTSYSFRGLDFVREIYISLNDSNDVKSTVFSEGCFYGCMRLETLEIPFVGRDWNEKSEDDYKYTLGYMFDYGTSGYSTYQYEKVSFPSSLTRIQVSNYYNYISAYAFSGMKYLTSFKTDANITSMGTYCFANCPLLETIEMVNSTYTRIPSYAFLNDVKLHDLDDFIPATVTSVGKYGLSGTSISDIQLNRYVSLEEGAFANCLQINTVDFLIADLNPNLKIGNYLFSGCKNLTNVILKVGYVSDYMFKNCTSLEGLVYDGIADYIPNGIFYGCVSLKDMYIDSNGQVKGLVLSPDSCGVLTIGDYAFYGCSSLVNFTLPTSLESIGKCAFQNCTGLTMLVIPRETNQIVLGTQNGVDKPEIGAFYGCNDDFYFEVYYGENEWPTGWGENWNCYFPVKTIGTSTENMFTYAYSTNLKGYLITGLNIYDANTNPIGYKFVSSNSLTVNGTLTFPDTYNGVKVYGLASSCFALNDYANYVTEINGYNYHILENVDKFVLGKNFIYMGEDALIYDITGASIFREVYVQKTSAQALVLADKDCGELLYEDSAQETILGSIQENILSSLNYDDEAFYTESGMIFYSESWQYVGSTIRWKTSALVFELNASNYTYALGKAIIPKIVGVSANPTYIKYAYGDPNDYLDDDRIINAFYSDPYDKNTLDLSPVNVSYGNNINVGTGRIDIVPNDSRFTGKTSVTFKIDKYKIDIGYESSTDKTAYGVHEDGTELSAVDHFVNIIKNNEIVNPSVNTTANYPNLRTVEIINHTYDGTKYSINEWFYNQNVFLPSGYTFTGVLETSSETSGFYIYNSNSQDYRILSLYDSYTPVKSKYMDAVLNSSNEEIKYSIGGFRWARTPMVYDNNGQDVTKNFSFNITLAVYIAPYQISEDSINWPGTYNNGYYEIEYTGSPIIPIPTVLDPNTYQQYDGKFEVSVTPENAIYPNSITGIDDYTATIIEYDTRNFRIPDGLKTIKFIIVKAKLTINLRVDDYVIGETQTQVMFDFADPTSFDQAYTLTYETSNGLGLTGHKLSGQGVTTHASGNNWLEGIYTHDGRYLYDGSSLVFTWDHTYITNGLGYKITNDLDVDCTEYFEVTCNFLVDVIYNTFDYNLTITDQNTGLTHDILGVDETIGIIDYVESQTRIDIIYGADGYEHVIDAKINNIQSIGDLQKLFNLTDANFKFTDIKEDGYEFNFSLSKTRFYPVSKTICIKVIKSSYVFLDISKEYDREAVDALDAFARLPIDFDLSKVTITYYKTNSKTLPISAPSAIGQYIFKVVTTEGHSEWFNDLLDTSFTDFNSKEFEITKRSIYIDVVDNISPFDSKEYDGEPWKLIVTDSYDMTKYNLLPGDALTGYFVSYSAEVGRYDASVDGTFRSFTPWSVINSSMEDSVQTNNYKIVYRGVYEIKLLNIEYTSAGVTATYDSENPQYYTIDLNITDPVYGYKVYYSEVELPPESGEWLSYKPYYINPGIYPVYFMIVADYYETVYGQETVTINAATMAFECDYVQRFNYDGFEHYLDIKLLNDRPRGAEIYYAVVDPTVYGTLSDEQIKALDYTMTPPSRTELGSTFVYVQVVARNYQTIFGMFTIIVEEQGIGQGVDVVGFENYYDTYTYGPSLDFTYAPSDVNPDTVLVYYYIGNSLTDSGVVWNEIDLWEVNYGASNTHNGKWMLPLMSEATDDPIKVSVRVLVPGYSITEECVTVHIKRLSLSLELQNYDGVFDNKFHTVLLSPGADCYDLLVDDKLNDDGTITYQYYFSASLYVDLIVKYHTSYNPVIGTLGFSTTVVKEKNVCNKNVFIEVSADNCESLFFNNGNITIRKNENPINNTDYDSYKEIEYLARNIEYKDLEITTVHDAYPLIKWIDNSTGLEIINTKELGSYHATVTFQDTGNCSEMIIDIDFDVVTRRLKLDYDNEVEYDGSIDNYPEINLVTVSECNDSTLLADIENNVIYGLVISEVGTYPSDYKDVYSGYQLLATLDPYLVEYELESNDIIYDIIKRKVYVTFYLETPYTGTGPYELDLNVTNLSSTEKLEIQGGDVKNILYGHTLQLHFETASFRRGTYTTKQTLSTNVYDKYSYIVGTNIVKVTGEILDDTNTIVNYYDLVLDVQIKIVLPELEVEVKDKTVTYNNNYHGLDIEILSDGVISFNVVYWYKEDPDYTFTSFSARDVGEYTVCYRISPVDEDTYEPTEGEATLIIERAYLDIEISEFDVTYDANYHTADHEIVNSGFIQFDNPICYTYYFDLDELEEQRITKEDLDDFFSNLQTYLEDGVPTKAKKIYKLYQNARTSIVNAGDYYTYVYYPETTNYYTSFGSGVITLKRRALYFINKTPMNPLVDSKIYDGVPLFASLTGFEYDYSDDSLNKTLDNAGLIMAGNYYLHDFDDNTFPGYEFMTSSANCKLDSNGEVIPYSDDGDFLFAASTVITSNASTDNLYDNYYPVFLDSVYQDPDTLTTYVSKSVRLTIERAELATFDVYDRIGEDAVEFNGEDVLPYISTPSDGKLVYFYRKVCEDIYGNLYYVDDVIYENQKEVTLNWTIPSGLTDVKFYYEVYVTIERGTNYHKWKGGGINDYVPITFTLPFPYDNNYYYKKALVEVIPAEVEIDWGDLEATYDGAEHEADPRFKDVATGKYIYLTYDVYDNEGNQILTGEMVEAGTYSLVAKLATINTSSTFGPENYSFSNAYEDFTILAKHYTIKEKVTTDYIYTYWSKDYTEDNFGVEIIGDDEYEDWLDDHTLVLNVKTSSDLAGRYCQGSHFTITYKLINGDGTDVSDSVVFTTDMDVLLVDGSIRYNKSYTEVVYDNQNHEADIEVTSHFNGYTIKYYSVELVKNADGVWVVPNDQALNDETWGSASSTAPKFIDVGYYRVYFQIIVSDSKQTEIDYVDVYIMQADSYIIFNDLGLDRTYNGLEISASELISKTIGGFNGDSSNLVFEWSDPITGEVFSSQPYTVGTYKVRVTSSADSNDSITKNYTPLEAFYTFTITPAKLTLVIESKIEVKTPTELSSTLTITTWNNGKNNTHQNVDANNDLESKLYGLKASDYVQYQLEFIGTAFEIYVYNYIQNEYPFESNYTEGFYLDADDNYLFSLTWAAYKSQITGPEDISNNYELYLDFELDVHYPYVAVNEENKSFDYDTNAKYFFDGTNDDVDTSDNLIEIITPSVSSLTYGTDYIVYYKTSRTSDAEWIEVGSTEDVGFVNPGTYNVYYKIEFNEANGYFYAPFDSVVTLKINYQKREVSIGIDQEELVYNGQERGFGLCDIETGENILDFITLTPIIGDLPDKSNWGIKFYDAVETSSGWDSSGLAMDTIINQGEYMVEITLPASSLYAETVIMEHFTYTRRMLYIAASDPDNIILMTYNGSVWRYNAVEDSENYLEITNFAPGQSLAKATLVSTESAVGTYVGSSYFRLESSSLDDLMIVDSEGNNVTENYHPQILDLSLTIEKADVSIQISPYDTTYSYPGAGEYITPTAVLLNPVGYNDHISYSIDNVNWQSTPINFSEIGTHILFVKSSNIPNYNDKVVPYTFEITMKSNNVVIFPLDKVYDFNPVSYPIIRTDDGYFDLAGPNMIVNGQYISVTWKEWNNSINNYIDMDEGEIPTQAGKYKVIVTYPETIEYYITENEMTFEIAPLEVNIDIGTDSELIYNTLEQAPSYRIYKKHNGDTISYLSAGIDYEIVYFEQNDTGVYDSISGSVTPPKNVGDYVMRITFIGDAANNIKFNVTNDVIEKDIKFIIVPREVKIQYSVVSNGNNVVTVTPSELQLTNFPSTVKFMSKIETSSNVSNTYLYKGYYDDSSWSSNGMLKWIDGYGTGPALQFTSDGTYDDISNYNIYIDVNIIISNGVIPYTVSKYDDIYDGLSHSFNFEVLLDHIEYDWEIQYSLDKQNWTYDQPTYINAMTRPVHIYTRVVAYVEGTTNYASFTPSGWVILEENSTDILYDQFEVMIHQSETTFDVIDYNLNKIYDGNAIVDPEVEYNYFEADNRKSEIIYSYFIKDDITGTYQQIASADVVNAGNYKLVVSMSGSTNYKPSTSNVEIDFEIAKRDLYIKVEGSKVFDNHELELDVTNANVVVPTSSTDSGLVAGHSIGGRLLTLSANAGEYTLHDHFKWHNEYIIIDNNSISVKNNYELHVYGLAKIEKADFDYIAHDGYGVYISDTKFYYINIEFLTTPQVTTSVLEDLIFYTLNMDEYGNSLNKDLNRNESYESAENIGICKGTYTVYFMIQAENYNTVFSSAKVVVKPQNTNFTVTSWPGLSSKLYYSGLAYDESAITYELNDDDGLPLTGMNVYWKFYKADGSGGYIELASAPIEAGEYAFKGFVDPSADAAYSGAESEYIPFTIWPYELEVLWEADIIETDLLGNKDYFMYFTGSLVTPTPYAKDLAGHDVQFGIVVNSPTGLAINSGSYTCTAVITDPTQANNYTITYVGSTDNISFEIIGNGSIPLPPIDPDETSFPSYLEPTDFTPGCKYVLSKMTFSTPQGNPYDGDNPYEFEESYYVVAHATYRCVDCGHEVNCDLILDMDSSGEIVTINGQTVSEPVGFNVDINYEDTVKLEDNGTTDTLDDYYYQEAVATLKDPLNTSWDIDNTTTTRNPITVRIKVSLKPIVESDILVTYSMVNADTGIDEPITDFKFAYTGDEITFDVYVSIIVRDSITGTQIDTIPLQIYDPVTGEGDYVVHWFNNVNETQAASLCIESLSTSGYDFELGDKDSGDSSDHYKTFIIYKELPDFIELVNPDEVSHNLHFRRFELETNDSGVKEWKVSYLNNEDRTNIVDPDINTSAATDSSSIRLTGLYQGMGLNSILDVLVNPLDCIKIELNNEMIYNGKISTDYILNPDGTISATPVTDYLVRTGLEIFLYKDNTQAINVDSITTVLYGDVDSDGEINVNDVITAATLTSTFAFDGVSEFEATYQACKCTDVQAFDLNVGFTTYNYEAEVSVNDVIVIATFTSDPIGSDINVAFS